MERLLQKPHTLDGYSLNIVEKEPEKELVFDKHKLLVVGLSDTTTDSVLEFYFEKISGITGIVKKIYRGWGGKVIVKLSSEIDFEMLKKNSQEAKPLPGGVRPHLKRIPESSAILVTGIPTQITEEPGYLDFYFESPRSSGGTCTVDLNKETNSAIIHFSFPSVADNVLSQSHTLGGVDVNVKPYYPFLVDENATIRREKKVEVKIPVERKIFTHVESYCREELKSLLETINCCLEWDEDSEVVTLSPKVKQQVIFEEWKRQTESVKGFYHSFEKREVRLHPDTWKQVRTNFTFKQEEKSIAANTDVSFNDSDFTVNIIGKPSSVTKVMCEVKEIQKAAEEIEQRKRSITTTGEAGFNENKLRFLEMSGFCEELQTQNQHLNIDVNPKEGKVCFTGPKQDLEEVKAKVFAFMGKVEEVLFERPKRVLDVLKTDAGVAHVSKTLNKRGLKAVICHEEQKASNEAIIVAENVHQARKAETTLGEIVGERSIHLEKDNATLLDTTEWKSLRRQLEKEHIVKLDYDVHTLWISGIEEHVKLVADIAKTFFEKNTILEDVVHLSRGCTRFLCKVQKSSLDKIQADLASCSFTCRHEINFNGIEVTGTAEGLDKGVSKIKQLSESVCDRNIEIKKPGLRKFIKQSKGAHLLKVIEDEHKCIFEKIEETPGLFATEKSSPQLGECKCSYVTPEGKKISVYKDDLTRHDVDVVVNAANEKLLHFAGLAGAIVKAGGKQIQEECAAFVQNNGPLLEGQVMMSNPGYLPCKKIIHAVGPKWIKEDTQRTLTRKKAKSEEYLKFAVTNALGKAAEYSSIAIPVISSGGFGFPRELCAKIIIEAAWEFCKGNPSINLSDIHLTNNDDVTVNVFVKEMQKKFENHTSFYDLTKPIKLQKPVTVSHSVPAAMSRREASQAAYYFDNNSFQTPEGVNISIHVGDIAQHSADVLVNSAADDLQLDRNECARAFRRAAGSQLQTMCNNEVQARGRSIPFGEIAITGSGDLQKKGCRFIFHAVCSGRKTGKNDKMVEQLFTKCLTEADNRGATSIAMPAIGTGVLGFQRNVVAKAAFDQATSYSRSNPRSSLKEIRFVVFDQSTVQAFKAELQKRQLGQDVSFFRSPQTVLQPQGATASVHPTVKERGTDNFQLYVGNICVQAQEGDLSKEKTTALCLVSNVSLDLKQAGKTSAEIAKMGGSLLETECRRIGKQQSGTVVPMHVPGVLNSDIQYLFHMIPRMMNPVEMKSLVLECLKRANSLKLRSVSFPAFGTGIGGLSAKECAHTIISAAADYSKDSPLHLKLVRIVVYQQKMLQDFLSVIKTMAGASEQVKQQGLIKRLRKWWNKEEENNEGPKEDDSRCVKIEVKLKVYGGSENDLDASEKALRDLVNEQCKQKVIEKDEIKNLTADNIKRIDTLAIKHDTKIQVEKAVGRIIVSGESEDIFNVSSEIYDMLDSIKEQAHAIARDRDRAEMIEMIAKDVQWYYLEQGKRKPYERDINAEIEVAYSKKENKVQLVLEDDIYEIDFLAMEESKPGSRSSAVKVFRRDLKERKSFPDYWIPQPKDPSGYEKKVHLVTLAANSPLYQRVSSKFHETCSQTIVHIQQIQNPSLFKTYSVNKDSMEERRPSNEKLLFHGTSFDKINNINSHGFNRNYCGKNATFYGDGVYFASMAKTSAISTYSPPNAQGERFMYLVRVLVGEYTVGRQGLQEPPYKDQNKSERYDTAVDQLPNPTIIVSFYDWQCYPDFLITFQ